MDDFVRHEPPLITPEKEMLVEWLDYHRATLLQKVAGLSDEDLRRKLTPSGLSLLGLVKHLANVERWWFQIDFAGRDIAPLSDGSDPDAAWRIEADESTEAILDLYKGEVRKARQIVDAANLDDTARIDGRVFSLRWIVVHMIEETARHNGHADILREMIDGVTGE